MKHLFLHFFPNMLSHTCVLLLQVHYIDKLYQVSIPLSIRAFMRETGGQVLKKQKKRKSEVRACMRACYPAAPLNIIYA